VAGQTGSITYVETAYALLHDKPCAYVQNKAGYYVKPSLEADAVALEGATLLPDLEQELEGVFNNGLPGTYPISAYSYVITQESTEQAQKGAVLGQFILFLACRGQQAAGQLGYSPLPPNLVQDDFNAVDRINGAARAPAKPTAANCPNPYVDGQVQLPGEPHVVGQSGGGQGSGSGTGTGTGTQTGTTTPSSGGHGKGPGKGKGSQTGSTTTTTLPAGVITPSQSQTTTTVPGFQLLNAVSGLAATEGPSGSTVGIALASTLVVLGTPAIWLSRRRRARRAGRSSQRGPK
ncbi:MAG TPA: hypothetical protein VGP46_08200, partial [Acidimicrobiales bacterium]|nr:hypothetical protein [Acidimicrobiales bacterium]